jgi:hypothetical protein
MKTKINFLTRKITIIAMLCLLCMQSKKSDAFCGFYVARQDVQLVNKTSQVILVRDGDRTTITMSSDFKGTVNEFAMVIPVPVVIQKNDIKVVSRSLFDQFDAYSGPRLVEYYDPAPCNNYMREESMVMDMVTSAKGSAENESKDEKKLAKYKVTIDAKYTVGEYDILVLSAKESGGLKRWLLDNGYKIPEGAEEVLDPYIKSNMKFFVVKVNLDEQRKTGMQLLRPIQISFNTQKFMLPIRLGMANGSGSQDLIVYAITKNGRVESTNYRTVKVPSDRNIPEFVSGFFGKFYASLYKNNLRKEGKDNVFLEYAWDISGQAQVKCDPCASAPPLANQLSEAGVNWINYFSGGYTGNVFFTRMHITYDRENFPQDLVFQETPNRENFQCRYIITHPANSSYNTCSEWGPYRENTIQRRKKEVRELAALTGWEVERYWEYPAMFQNYNPPTSPELETGSTDKPVDPFIQHIPNTNLDPGITPTASRNKFNTNISSSNISIDTIMPEETQTNNSTIDENAVAQTDFIDDQPFKKETTKDWIPGFGIIALAAIAGLAALHKKTG